MKLQRALRIEYLVAWIALFLLAAMTVLASAAEAPLHRGRLSPNDYRFAVAAAQGNMMNVDLGRLALKKTNDPRVRQFGEEMIRDHRLDNEELENVLSENGATMPVKLTHAQQSEIGRLSRLPGPAFDREYMALMIREHLKYLSDFNDAAVKAKSPDLRKLALNTARVTEYDLNMAEAFRNGK